jgi:hypothetical protein
MPTLRLLVVCDYTALAADIGALQNSEARFVLGSRYGKAGPGQAAALR